MSRTRPENRLWLLAPATVALLAACAHGPATTRRVRPADTDSVQVGYGMQARRDLTTSVSSVDGDAARTTTATSMADLLEGRVPGLEVRRMPGGAVSVRIRGTRSLNMSSEPLCVIDGIPIQLGAGGTLPDIDPRDVKRVEVLKDAGALAAYGSRGANGVILITTRRGSDR